MGIASAKPKHVVRLLRGCLLRRVITPLVPVAESTVGHAHSAPGLYPVGTLGSRSIGVILIWPCRYEMHSDTWLSPLAISNVEDVDTGWTSLPVRVPETRHLVSLGCWKPRGNHWRHSRWCRSLAYCPSLCSFIIDVRRGIKQGMPSSRHSGCRLADLGHSPRSLRCHSVSAILPRRCLGLRSMRFIRKARVS